jgi:uncharacterized membrane protein YhdT
VPRSRTITPRTARRRRILLLILISAGFVALAGAELFVFTTGLRNRIFLAVVIVASFLIADAYFRWGVESMRAFLRGLTLFELLIVYLVVTFLVGRANGTIQFYEVSAQLIPLLVLALIYQSNAFSLRRIRNIDDLSGLMVSLGALATGEVVALRAIFTGKPSGAPFVAGAIGMALAGILIFALIGSEASSAEVDPATASRRSKSPEGHVKTERGTRRKRGAIQPARRRTRVRSARR